METRAKTHGTHALVPDTLALVVAFRELSAELDRLEARGVALRHEWATVLAEDLLCDSAQQPAEMALFDELTNWLGRVRHLNAGPLGVPRAGHHPAARPLAEHGPGYFVG